MWGDIKVWAGSKEVIILKWYERLWRFMRGRTSNAAYDKVARQFQQEEEENKRFFIKRELERQTLGELEYGDLRTTLGGERDGQP